MFESNGVDLQSGSSLSLGILPSSHNKAGTTMTVSEARGHRRTDVQTYAGFILSSGSRKTC